MKALRAPFNSLASYYYLDRFVPEMINCHAAGVRFIGDSGAYSAMTLGKTIKLEGYMSWLDKIDSYLDWAASLDVIGDAAGTWSNFTKLRRAGHNVVPTVHYGTPATELDRYVGQGCDLVGLGGVARRRDHQAVLRWLVSMFRYAKDRYPGLRFHCWGTTRRTYMTHLPFWSVDSSIFTAGFRWGRLEIFDEKRGETIKVYLDGSGGHATQGERLRKRFGVTPAELMTSGSWNRKLLIGMAGHCAQDMETYYTARHAATPPASLAHLGNGTRVHLVDHPALDHLAAMIAKPVRT